MLSEKLSDYGITRPRKIDTRHTGLFWYWAVFGCSCCILRTSTRFNRAFRSVFRFVSDNISDNICIVCTQTAFFIEKQKALDDFQIIFQTIFASFVPDLRPTIYYGIFFSPYFWSFQRSPKPRNQNHLRVLWDRKSSLLLLSVLRGGKNKRILSELAPVLTGLCCF